MLTVVGYGALFVLLGCGMLIAVAAAGGQSFLVSTTPGHFPTWITGPLSGFGETIGRPRFLTLMVLMWLAYAVVIVVSRRLRPVAALSVLVALHIVLFLAPPLMSTDIFSYVDYARLGALHGLNPYVRAPAAAPYDPVYRLVGAKWTHTATAYGPLFTLMSYPLARLSVPNAVWALKGLAALASVGCVGLLWRCARLRDQDKLRAALLFGLNPLVVIYAVGGGHNDLLMIALMLGCVALALAPGRERVAGIALVAATAIKASSIVILAFLVLGTRRPRRVLAGALVGLAAAVAASDLVFHGEAWRSLAVVREQQEIVGAESFPHQLARLFGLEHAVPVMTIAHVALALTAVALLVTVRRGADWVTASGWMLLTLVATTSFLLPWYTIWALPLAAISDDRRLLIATLFVQALFFAHQLGPLLGA
ncbi:MAG: polyprenol phosphomannose-dependent alpha 1,6 mannosyltransferase MptB [Actinobacteria bacterium]|nr:polyprenol phosphomannose-dependent alpha 1,6 mannosyltransferase MptB [Actinomycetota bacterium]